MADLVGRRGGDVVTFSSGVGLVGLSPGASVPAGTVSAEAGTWVSATGGMVEASDCSTSKSCVHGPNVDEIATDVGASAPNPRCENSC